MQPKAKKTANQTERFSAVRKTSRLSMKDALLDCFVGMGGSDALVKWANQNQTEAYKLIAKHTIPTRVEMGGIDGEAIRLEMTNATASARRKLNAAAERDGSQKPARLTH